MIIYCILHNKTHRAYVGQSCQPLRVRVAQHLRSDRTGIGAAMRRLGRKQFSVVQLATCETEERADQLERRWITILRALEPYGYNRKEGGDGHRAHGRPLCKKFHKRPKREIPEYAIDEPDTDLLEKARQEYFDSFSLS